MESRSQSRERRDYPDQSLASMRLNFNFRVHLASDVHGQRELCDNGTSTGSACVEERLMQWHQTEALL